MIIVEKDYIHNIPILHVVNFGEYKNNLPLIIFIHGVTSAKEHNLHYAYLLAEKGYRVILPEALHHGERGDNLTQKDIYARFWEIVLKTIQEVKIIKEYYVQKGLADDKRIGLAGTSMGGIVTLGALTQFPWIKTAVSLMGMPAYEEFSLWQLDQLRNQGIDLPFTPEQISDQLSVLRDFDLSLHPEKLNHRPLLFWHAENDPVVPYALTYKFFESIQRDNQDSPERLTFITDRHAGHKVSREGLLATVEWFEKYL